ncbi:MAG: PCYCGC motif-containing (lipo)protein [Acidobacteriota bacterium]
MSKPSKKNPSPPPPQEPVRGKAPLVIGAVAIVAIAVGAYTFMQSERAEPQASATAATPAAAPAGGVPAPVPAAEITPPAPAVALAPHPQKDYPPLELPAYPLGRSPEVITAAYRFAAEHPEVLTYVPCFCGCERSGHKGNEDCFVKSRAANGDVSEWEPHGMECNVCVDVATQAKQMYSSGASVRDIRAAVEQKWAKQAEEMHTHTPTPQPPK